jgi:hypothetical protein
MILTTPHGEPQEWPDSTKRERFGKQWGVINMTPESDVRKHSRTSHIPSTATFCGDRFYEGGPHPRQGPAEGQAAGDLFALALFKIGPSGNVTSLLV